MKEGHDWREGYESGDPDLDDEGQDQLEKLGFLESPGLSRGVLKS